MKFSQHKNEVKYYQMDKLNHYRQSIHNFLSKYANVWKEEEIETQIIIDVERDRYLLLRIGWEGNKRINYSVFQFDIKNDKIWVQENTTDVEIDQEFEEMGISKKEMVIGFHHPSMREYSDYSIA